MAKKRTPSNQILPDIAAITEKQIDRHVSIYNGGIPEYNDLAELLQSETSSIVTDYVRQYVNVGSQPGSGIFLNFDRVAQTQTFQELAWFDMYAEVERDPHIKAILDSAKINVAGMKWDVEAHMEAGEKEPTSRNQAIADFVKHALTKTGFFPQHLYNLMGALGMGFSASEIVWKIDDNGIGIEKILNRPPRRFQFDAITRAPRLRTQKEPYYGEPLPEKKFIIHRCSSTWENPFGDPIDQSLYWMWLFKKTAIKFALKHLETGASAIPIVKHPKSADVTLKGEALDIAKMIRNGSYGRMPDSFEIIWAEAPQLLQSAEAFTGFIRFCNDEMSKAVNGQTLTTEASSQTGTGTRALGTVHQGTMNARDVYRAEALASTLNDSAIKWLVDFNFSGIEGYPKFRFDLEDPQDLVRESQIVKNLNDAGYDFDQEELSNKFNYTLTKKEAKPIPALQPKQPDGTQPVEEPILEDVTK